MFVNKRTGANHAGELTAVRAAKQTWSNMEFLAASMGAETQVLSGACPADFLADGHDMPPFCHLSWPQPNEMKSNNKLE